MRAKIQVLQKVTRENNTILTDKSQALRDIQTNKEEFKGEPFLVLHYEIRDEHSKYLQEQVPNERNRTAVKALTTFLWKCYI